jgi:hypothetical protein
MYLCKEITEIRFFSEKQKIGVFAEMTFLSKLSAEENLNIECAKTMASVKNKNQMKAAPKMNVITLGVKDFRNLVSSTRT